MSGWLEQIGKERNFPLSLEEDGHCIIPCEDNLNCIIEVPDTGDIGAIFIYLPLVSVPEQSTLQLATINKAMQINLFGLLTGGCHLGIDTRTNFIVLSFSSTIEALDETIFKLILSDMLLIAPNLRQRLQAVANPELTVGQMPLSNEAFFKQAHFNRLKISTHSAQRS